MSEPQQHHEAASPVRLSEVGAARRAGILERAHAAQHARVVRRRLVRTGIAAVVIAGVSVGLLLAVRPSAPSPAPRLATETANPPKHPRPVALPDVVNPRASIAVDRSPRVRVVRTQPGTVLKVGGASAIRRIEDQELDAALAEAGRTGGVVRINDRVIPGDEVARETEPDPDAM